jgi:hypothetical protein
MSSRVFIPSFRRRRRSVPEVAVAAEIKPLEWTSHKKKQCEYAGCPYGEAPGIPKWFKPTSGDRTCSPHCRKALRKIEDLKYSRTPKARATQLRYRQTNRDTIRKKYSGPKAAKYQRDRYAAKKAAAPPIMNTCLWWTAVAEGAITVKTRRIRFAVQEGMLLCPSAEGKFQAKTKHGGCCSDECRIALRKIYVQNWKTPNPDTKPARQKLANRKFRDKQKKKDQKVIVAAPPFLTI